MTIQKSGAERNATQQPRGRRRLGGGLFKLMGGEASYEAKKSPVQQQIASGIHAFQLFITSLPLHTISVPGSLVP